MTMSKKGQKRKKAWDSDKQVMADRANAKYANENLGMDGPQKKSKTNLDLADQSLDDFLQSWQKDVEQHDSDTEESDNDEGDDEINDDNDANEKYLSKLAQKDPEFYQFLQENDKDALAGIDEDALDSSEENSEVDAVHHVPDSLEIASDESDFEEEEEEQNLDRDLFKQGKKPISKGPVLVKKRDLNLLEERLIAAPTVKAMGEMTQMFRGALNSLGGQEKQKEMESSDYVVEGSAMFNSVIRLCLTKMAPSLFAVLGVKESKVTKDLSMLTKNKKWSSLSRSLRCYTMDLTRLLAALSEDNVRGALLKHCHVMLPFFAAMAKSCKHLTAQLVKLWSTGEESVRVLAFLCLVRLTRLLDKSNYDIVVKQMYMSYVRNCRFTSPSTWPLIAFMRRSLAEMLALDPAAAYNHTFIYTRQLGISLRNALMAQKKESVQAVYNWQFVHSCHLWAQFLGSMSSSEILSPLVFPLTQVIQGAIKLVYTTRYYPLRFHLVQVLARLCAETGSFVPILPHYLDILQNFDFNRKTTRVSMRPLDFSCLLKVNKIQLQENGMKDTTLDKVYGGMLSCLSAQSSNMSFPELSVPCIMQMRTFLKTCKVANYCKKMKQLVEKVEENRSFIENQRKNVAFKVSDKESVLEWESEISAHGTPLSHFHNQWKKLREEETRKAKKAEEDKDYDFIPAIKKKSGQKKVVDESTGLWDENEDSDGDDENRFASKEEKRQRQRTKLDEEDDDDIEPDQDSVDDIKEEDDSDDEDYKDEADQVEDFRLDDLESSDEDDIYKGDEESLGDEEGDDVEECSGSE